MNDFSRLVEEADGMDKLETAYKCRDTESRWNQLVQKLDAAGVPPALTHAHARPCEPCKTDPCRQPRGRELRPQSHSWTRSTLWALAVSDARTPWVAEPRQRQ